MTANELVRTLFRNPLLKGVDRPEDLPVDVTRSILRNKIFLRKVYEEWYDIFIRELPAVQGLAVEVGTRGGILSERLPDVVTSDIFFHPSFKMVLDAQKLPFRDASLSAILMVAVLHHLPSPESFFNEATRCLRPGGAVLMVEPWVSAWSSLIYGRFHNEPYHPESNHWLHVSREKGPEEINIALPWLIFSKNRTQWEKRFPGLRIDCIKPFMPFRFLLSGGFPLVSLMPAFTFGFWRFLERCFEPWMDTWATQCFIKLTRKPGP